MAEIVVNSSLIQSYDYDSDSKVLTVNYKSNQSQWEYKNVTQSLVDQIFNSGGSVGSRLHRILKLSGPKGPYSAVQIG